MHIAIKFKEFVQQSILIFKMILYNTVNKSTS